MKMSPELQVFFIKQAGIDTWLSEQAGRVGQAVSVAASELSEAGSQAIDEAAAYVEPAITQAGFAIGEATGRVSPPKKEDIQNQMQQFSMNVFTPENTRNIMRDLTKSQVGGGGETPTQIFSRYQPDDAADPETAPFLDAVGKNIGQSLGQAIPQSGKWNMLTSLGMDFMKSSSSAPLMRNLGDTVGSQFKPQTPAIQTAADNIAEIGQAGVDQTMGQNLSGLGQGLYHLFTGNFDKLIDMFGGDSPGTGASTGGSTGAADGT